MTDLICRDCGRPVTPIVTNSFGGSNPIPLCPMCLGLLVPFSSPSISLDEIRTRRFNLMAQWTCHVCGKERPDTEIGVRKRDIGVEYGLSEGVLMLNVRYCINDPDCVEKSKTWNFPKP